MGFLCGSIFKFSLWSLVCYLLINTSTFFALVSAQTEEVIVDLGFCFSLSATNQQGQRIPLPDHNLKELATAIKAVHDINNSNGTIIPALDGYQSRCPIQFSYTVLDTVSSFSRTIQQYNNLKAVRGLPQAIVGPSRSSSTIPLSFVSAADHVPIVGFSATSTELDDKISHEFFSRLIPSDQALSRSLVSLIREFNYARVSLLYVDDDYGRSIKDELFRFADTDNIALNLFPFDVSDSESIDNALSRLQETKLNIVIAVIFEEDVEEVLINALSKKLIGNGKLWIFTDSVSSSAVAKDLANKNEDIANALLGSMQVFSTGSVSDISQRFKQEFPSFNSTPDMIDHLPGGVFSIEDLPQAVQLDVPTDLMSSGATEFTAYVYDAVVTIALALEKQCDILLGPQRSTRIVAELYQETITNVSFQFDGVTGSIHFQETGSRDPSTVDYPLYNFQPGSDGVHRIDIVPVGSYDFTNEVWSLKANDFVFSDLSSNPPPFTAVPYEEKNLISRQIRIASNVTTSIVLFIVLLLAFWIYLQKREPVIKASQPLFLYMVLLGVTLSASSVYIDQLVEFYPNNMMCHAPYYLISIGFTLVAASLSAKLYRIFRIFNNPSLTVVRVTNRFLLTRIGATLFINVALLACWTIFVPLEYRKKVVEEDEFGQPLESYSVCEAKGEFSFLETLFWVLLALFHFLQYLVGGYYSYKTTNAPSDFQEGKWISISVLSQGQLFLFGIPVIFAIDERQTAIRTLIQAVLILLVNFVLVLLLFIPKFYRLNCDFGWNNLLVNLGLREQKVKPVQLKIYSDDSTHRGHAYRRETESSTADGNEMIQRLSSQMKMPSKDNTAPPSRRRSSKRTGEENKAQSVRQANPMYSHTFADRERRNLDRTRKESSTV